MNAQSQPDLVVLSHLRWPWVWQRPQHLISRFAEQRAKAGATTWFVEEPIAGPVEDATILSETSGPITRVWLEVAGVNDPTDSISFTDPRAARYGELLAELLERQGCDGAPDRWLYTPMAYDIAQHLGSGRVVYDVMDDLSAFRYAPEGLRLRQRQLLGGADIVFTGGRSLHRSTLSQRHRGVHLFPSGVESEHYATSRRLRQSRDHKVAGYVGVIDERLDLELLAAMAAALPDWSVQIVGPVVKIDKSLLPTAENISYPGLVAYDDLPEVMAGFDVALMPFALNEATRAISPTKTLEYLAAGLPVVSTRIADVVTDYAEVVHLADDGVGFANACREVVTHRLSERDRRLRPIQARQEWDYIAAAMSGLLDEVGGATEYETGAQDVSA